MSMKTIAIMLILLSGLITAQGLEIGDHVAIATNDGFLESYGNITSMDSGYVCIDCTIIADEFTIRLLNHTEICIDRDEIYEMRLV